LSYIISGVSALALQAAALARSAVRRVWKELYQVNLSNKALVDERFLL